MKHLTTEQRYQIEAYLKLGASKDFIAKELQVDRSTIYREVKRNQNKRGAYSAKQANEFYSDRKDRFISFRTFTPSCEQLVVKLIKKQWSPEQIKGYCARNNLPMVSHERIYQYIRKDKFNGGDLYTHLRHKLKYRKRPVGKHFPIANRVSIDERPEVVELKTRFGDWEMDTIIGANQQGAILTLTERMTNFVVIRKLQNGKNSKALAKELISSMLTYKDHVHTITTDNGPEFADHMRISRKMKSPIYFAHPYCSWEKGSIEHANKLIRQYVYKESDLTVYSQHQLTQIQHKINDRPRKKLDFDSPKNLFYNLVDGNVAFAS
jgi:IS30 family transposase